MRWLTLIHQPAGILIPQTKPHLLYQQVCHCALICFVCLQLPLLQGLSPSTSLKKRWPSTTVTSVSSRATFASPPSPWPVGAPGCIPLLLLLPLGAVSSFSSSYAKVAATGMGREMPVLSMTQQSNACREKTSGTAGRQAGPPNHWQEHRTECKQYPRRRCLARCCALLSGQAAAVWPPVVCQTVAQTLFLQAVAWLYPGLAHLLRCQAPHFSDKVFLNGAADAAVGQGHQLLPSLLYHGTLQQALVDVQRSHVIDQHCYTLPLLV